MKKTFENRSNRIVEVIRNLVLKLMRRADYDPVRIYLKIKKAQQRRYSF